MGGSLHSLLVDNRSFVKFMEFIVKDLDLLQRQTLSGDDGVSKNVDVVPARNTTVVVRFLENCSFVGFILRKFTSLVNSFSVI